MHRLYTHLEWREFLVQEQESRRESDPSFTWKAIAEKISMDPAQFHRVVRGKASLPLRFVPAIADVFGLDRRGAAYFEELLRLERARSEEERVRSRERLHALRGVALRSTGGRQAEFYSRWHHSVIRALLGMGASRGDGSQFGALCLPPVSPEEARGSIELLLDLGLVQRETDGRLRVTDSHLTTGGDVPVATIRKFHQQTIELARSALERIPAGERDISAVTASLDADGIETLREMARDLRQKVQTLSHAARDPDRVFQMNIQIFPVGFGTPREAS